MYITIYTKIFYISSYMFRSTWTILRELTLSLAVKLITMYSWLILQKCNFSQAQSELPEDGPGGPKHVGANTKYFNVNFNVHFNILYV
jgi:hypothetical protein